MPRTLPGAVHRRPTAGLLARRQFRESQQVAGGAMTFRQAYGRIGDRRVLAHRRGDFTQLNAVSADFDLAIDPPQKLDVAIRPVSSPISGQVQAPPVIAGHKTRGGLLSVHPVTVRQPVTADGDLTADPVGAIVQAFINNMQLLIGQRLTIRNALPGRRDVRDRMEYRPDCRFSRAAQRYQLTIG